MSFCDFDLLSACGSLDGFPGQEDAASPSDSPSPSVAKNLEDLEDLQLRDRARIAAAEASRTAALSADRYPFEFPTGGDDLEVSPYELAYSDSIRPADPVGATLSVDPKEPESGLETVDLLVGPAAIYPPTRPPTPASPASRVSASTPSLCPSSPSTCALDEEQFRAIFPSYSPPYLDGDELLSRFPPRARTAANSTTVARYVPPALRKSSDRQKRERERRERRERNRRARDEKNRAQQEQRVFYPTATPGVFDTIPPSEQKTLKVTAEKIADNCFTIAMSPRELENQLRHLDDDARRTIHRITDLLRANTPGNTRVKIVRILQCAIHASYGLDFKCVTSTGAIVWYRDVNMRLDDPTSQELVYQYFADPRRTFSQEQIRKLRTLPQYWHEEGHRIFVPMMRRALPENVRPPVLTFRLASPPSPSLPSCVFYP